MKKPKITILFFVLVLSIPIYAQPKKEEAKKKWLVDASITGVGIEFLHQNLLKIYLLKTVGEA